MGKGWGLTLETSDPVGFLFNKPTAVGFSLTPRLNPMFSGGGTEFPVRLNPREEQAASSPADHDDRKVIGEVDFFSSSKSSNYNVGHDVDTKNNIIVVKKENSHGESTVRTDLDVNTGLHLLTANTVSDQSSVDDGVSSNAEDKRAKHELAVLQVELERMNTENQRLRGMLSQVSNNYSALQIHLVSLMQQQQLQQNSRADQSNQEHERDDTQLPRQFFDLGPNVTHPSTGMDEPSRDSSSEEKTQSGSGLNTAELSKNGKRIGREETPDSEGWVSNKVQKSNVPKGVEQTTEATMRKARVSVRARSEAPMISDGCQWRKYGQKMAKGNPCPRAYYRCTMAVGCPVRKQVQRCADDRTILITTYEGNHNHPLPPAAMAMASTTSAAANMLLSGSMSSADGLMNPNILARAILPSSSSIATISASAPFPTVTLDLTHTPDPFQRPATTQFQAPFQGPPQNFPSMPAPHMFGQGLYNQSKFSGLQSSHDHTESNQLPHHPPPPQFHQSQPQTSFSDTLTAATAAITADPNFTAALAAAITSIMGGNNSNAAATTANNNNNNNNSNNSNNHPNFPTRNFPGN